MLQAVRINSMWSAWDLKSTYTFDQKKVYKEKVCGIVTKSRLISFNTQKRVNSSMKVVLFFVPESNDPF